MSASQRAKALRRVTLLAATTALVLAGGSARAASAPVSGTPGVVTVGSGQALPSVSPDGATAYVVTTDSDGNLVVRAVDTRSGQVTGTAPLGAAQGSPQSALSPDGSRLYVVNGLQLSVVATGGPTVLATVPLPDQPRPTGWSQGLVSGLVAGPDGSEVYLVQQGPSAWRQGGQARVLAFGTAQRQFGPTVGLPALNTGAPALHPNGRDLYIGGGAGLYHVSAAGGTLTFVRTVPGTATNGDNGLAFTRDGGRLFATGPNSGGTLDLIDPATDTLLRSIRTVPVRSDVPPRLSADSSRFYLLQQDSSGTTAVISVDTATATVDTADSLTPQESALDGLAVGPDGHTLYVGGTNDTDAQLEVLGL
ncbi:hypothetical protein ACFC1T_05340 [Kitasatospora sp. NPDC056076]|uniref:hypothetical protein n=1 Tax=Kitasatospora sp. NPDC056076 TaxID=3345703 RepID=UPI0035D89A76